MKGAASLRVRVETTQMLDVLQEPNPHKLATDPLGELEPLLHSRVIHRAATPSKRADGGEPRATYRML
jgi:hypothetical protein